MATFLVCVEVVVDIHGLLHFHFVLVVIMLELEPRAFALSYIPDLFKFLSIGTGSCCSAQAGLEFVILLCVPPWVATTEDLFLTKFRCCVFTQEKWGVAKRQRSHGEISQGFWVENSRLMSGEGPVLTAMPAVLSSAFQASVPQLSVCFG